MHVYDLVKFLVAQDSSFRSLHDASAETLAQREQFHQSPVTNHLKVCGIAQLPRRARLSLVRPDC